MMLNIINQKDMSDSEDLSFLTDMNMGDFYQVRNQRVILICTQKRYKHEYIQDEKNRVTIDEWTISNTQMITSRKCHKLDFYFAI